MPPSPKAALDVVKLEEALRALGLLYGKRRVLEDVAAGAGDEESAIRAYIAQERPHLLHAYTIESLVELVRGAMNRGAQHGPVLEQFTPKG